MTQMTRHRAFIALTVLEVATLGGLLALGRASVQRAAAGDLPAKRQVVERLGLTDLSLWTDARYTRHPSQADLFSAFQDFPSAPDHFPSGSIVPAPPGLRAFQRDQRADDGARLP
jgi:hypothetical protein